MIEIQGISLILTNKCNASCRHCGLAAGPDQNAVMPAEKAREYIKAVSKYESVKIVSYTGGEPFLRYDDLKNIISCAGSLGLYGEVVTNSFWASDREKTEKILKDLKSMGVVNFVTSLDDFHAEYINPEYIKIAVRAACELEYNVTVKVMAYPNAAYSYDYVRKLLDADNNQIKLVNQSPVISGRAVNIQDTAGLKAENAEKSLGGKCGTVIKFPTIHPAGEVYPCCGFGQDLRLLGNACSQPLDNILFQMQRNLFFNLIAHIGPVNLLQEVRKYMKKTPQDNFLNSCEVCNYIVQDRDVSSAVRRLMEEMAAG